MMLNDYVTSAALLGAIDWISVGIMGFICLIAMVFAILSAKTWHWVNIVFLGLTLVAGITASFGLSQVYEQRTADMQKYVQESKRLERAETQLMAAIVGDELSATPEPGSLRATDEKLSQLLIGRGRVWNGGTVTPPAQGSNQLTFTFAAPRDIAAEGELKDFDLYAFLDGDVAINGQQYPGQTYIGSVRVVNETNDSLTVEPIDLAAPQVYVNGQGNWTLFEKMPLDRHGLFRDAIVSEAETNPNANNTYKRFAASVRAAEENPDEIIDIAAFRAILKNEFLTAQRLGYQPDSAEYEKIIDRYAFDGLPLGKIAKYIEANSDSRISPRFEPLPEETFYRVKFNKKSNAYRVDSTGSLENDGAFTLSGEAVIPQLKNNGDVEFNEGDVVLIDLNSFEGYSRGQDSNFKGIKDTEDVEVIDTIYKRQLTDFPYEFAQIKYLASKVINETQRITIASKKQDKAYADAQKQIEERARVIAAHKQDQEKLEADLARVQQVRQDKENQVAQNGQQIEQMRSQLNELYLKIREASLEIARKAFTTPTP